MSQTWTSHIPTVDVVHLGDKTLFCVVVFGLPKDYWWVYNEDAKIIGNGFCKEGMAGAKRCAKAYLKKHA